MHAIYKNMPAASDGKIVDNSIFLKSDWNQVVSGSKEPKW